MSFIKAGIGRVMKELRNHFAAGLLVLLPIYLSFWVIIKLANLIDRPIREYLEAHVKTILNIEIHLYGIGILVTLLIILSAGVITRFFIGRKMIGLFERIFERTPVLNRVYVAIRHVIHTILGRKRNIFERVVVFEYPRRGLWTLGFVTSSDYKEAMASVDKDLICVFVPTAPNPTSGYFFMIPERDLRDVSITIEDAMKMIVSAGAVGPDKAFFPGAPPLPPHVTDGVDAVPEVRAEGAGDPAVFAPEGKTRP